ncbi:MAG: hypothetical protein B6241_05700 [Spirochaetaceae bacterium 4572_59]|nr:MAG: hypothetical protein B6241_05700 [Spirochaetaceae bacterium 4572_59]
MLDPSLKNLLIETISQSIKTKEIDEIGKMLSKGFDLNKLSGMPPNVTIAARLSGTVLVEYMESKDRTGDLIKLIAELDNNMILGRTLSIDGLDYFLQQLTLNDYVYDFRKRKVVPLKEDPHELPNWGALKDGKKYPITIMSLDIVSNSELVKKYGAKTMKKVYINLWKYLKDQLSKYNGRIWSWAGDGGILAFAFKNHIERAVIFAFEVQRTIFLFNMDPHNPIEDNIELRIGIHTGKLVYHNDSGTIVSEVINLAAHLEKRAAEAGYISITVDVHKTLTPRYQKQFEKIGLFEGTDSYKTLSRLDNF